MAAVTLLGTQTFNINSGTKTVVATPAVGDLILIITAHTGNTSAALPTDNNADNAGTYQEITNCVKATSADTMRVFVRQGKIGSATSTTFTHAPGTSTGGGLVVLKVTGMFRSGLNAVRQSAVQSNQAAATPAPVFGSAALTGNACIGAVFNATNPATMTARASWTERQDSGYATPTTGLESMSRDSGETGTTQTWGSASASAFCALVVELDATEPPPQIADAWDHWLADEDLSQPIAGGYFQHIEEPLASNEIFWPEEDDDNVDHSAFSTAPVVGNVVPPADMPVQETVQHDDDLEDTVEGSAPVGADVVPPADMPPQDVPAFDDDLEVVHVDSWIVPESPLALETPWRADDGGDDDQVFGTDPVGENAAVLVDALQQHEWDYGDDDLEQVVVPGGYFQEPAPALPLQTELDPDDADDEWFIDSAPVVADVGAADLSMLGAHVHVDDELDDDQVFDSRPVVADAVVEAMPPQDVLEDDGYLGLLEFVVLDFAQVEEDPKAIDLDPDFQEEAFDDWMPESAPVADAVPSMPVQEVPDFDDTLEDTVEGSAPVGADVVVGASLQSQTLPEPDEADEEWVQTDTAPVAADVVSPADMPVQETVLHDDDLEDTVEGTLPVGADLPDYVHSAHVEPDEVDDDLVLDSRPVTEPDELPQQEVPAFDDDLEDSILADSALHSTVDLALANEVLPEEDVEDWQQPEGVLGEDLFRSAEVAFQHAWWPEDHDDDDDNWWRYVSSWPPVSSLYALDPRWRISYPGGWWVDGFKAEAPEVDYKVVGSTYHIKGKNMRQRFRDAKVSQAKEVLWFDFSQRLESDEILTGILVQQVTVSFGTDPTPSALFNGPAYLTPDAKGVLVPVQGGTLDVDYDIKIVASTNNPEKSPGMVGTLAVRL